MSDLQRETLGSIWRLCEQMAYSAERGFIETLTAQYETLKKLMVKLELVEQIRKGE